MTVAGANRRFFFFTALTAVMTMAAWAYGHLFHGIEIVHGIVVPLSFLGLGMLIKYGDQAFDENSYSKRKTILLAIPGGLWMGLLMAFDAGSATIFMGILLSLLLAGKYDNIAFQLGFGTALAIGVGSLLLGFSTISVLGAAIVLALSFLDEKVNDLPGVDRANRWWEVLFHHRSFLKIGVLALCLLGLLPSLLYFFAFLAFDFGYIAIEAFSDREEVPALG